MVASGSIVAVDAKAFGLPASYGSCCSSGAKTIYRVGMNDLRLRQIASNEPIHPLPRPCRSTLLTATSQLVEPELGDLGHELIESTVIVRDGRGNPANPESRSPTSAQSPGRGRVDDVRVGP